jgi:hypothetical protein
MTYDPTPAPRAPHSNSITRDHTRPARDVIALVAALWFLATGWFWSYLACLFIAYPAAIISFFVWRRRDAPPTALRKATPIVLALGLLVSIVAFFVFS